MCKHTLIQLDAACIREKLLRFFFCHCHQALTPGCGPSCFNPWKDVVVPGIAVSCVIVMQVA